MPTPAVNDPETSVDAPLPSLIIPFFYSSGLELCSLPPRLHFPSLIHPRLSFSTYASEVVLRLCCLVGGVLLYHQLLSDLLVLLSSGGSLLGLVAAELLLGLGLDGLVGSLDGGSTLDGSGAEVRAVAVLGDLVGNSLVGPLETVSAVLGGFLRRNRSTCPKLTCGWT